MSFLSKLRNGVEKSVCLFTVEALQSVGTRKLSIQAVNMRITSKVGTNECSKFVRGLPTDYVREVLKCNELSPLSISTLHQAQLERMDKLRKERFASARSVIENNIREETQKYNEIATKMKNALSLEQLQKDRLKKATAEFNKTDAEATQKQKEQNEMQKSCDSAREELAQLGIAHGQVMDDIKAQENKTFWNKVCVVVALAGVGALVIRCLSSSKSSGLK